MLIEYQQRLKTHLFRRELKINFKTVGPGATNNLEHFSTEEFQIICTLGITSQLEVVDAATLGTIGNRYRLRWWGQGPRIIR